MLESDGAVGLFLSIEVTSVTSENVGDIGLSKKPDGLSERAKSFPVTNWLLVHEQQGKDKGNLS